MKIARLVAPRKFEFQTVTDPVMGENESIIKLERWSICGTDIRSAYGQELSEDKYPLGIGEPCHELAGTIVDTKDENLKIGDRAIVFPTVGGYGGLVEFLSLPSSNIVKLPSHGDLSEWVVCQPASTAMYGCKSIGSWIGKTVAIIGQGGIGLSFTAMISKLGAERIIACDTLAYRLKYAKQFGATDSLNGNEVALDEGVRELTNGEMVDVVVDAAGYSESFEMAPKLLKRGGTFILFGIHHEVDSSDKILSAQSVNELIRDEIVIKSIGPAGRPNPTEHIREMIRLKERGWWDPANLITHKMKLKEVNDAYEMYEKRKHNIIKVVMS